MESDFYSILACPKCKGDLKKDKYGKFLHCVSCDEMYPIKEGIPDLRVIEKKDSKDNKKETKK